MDITPLSNQDVQQLRSETKGTSRTKHFNNAGSALPPDIVVETVVDYLQEEAIHGGYETEYTYRDQLENTYTQIATLLHAEKSEIALVENASIAWDIAFNGIDFKKGDVVITSEMEYVSNLIGFLRARETHGIEIKLIPNDANGNFSLPAFEDAISPQTKLIAITHIPSSAGNMLPIVEIGKIANKNNILYLVDACQSVGQVPIDVRDIQCDMLSVTGRKYLRGPRGTGFLYVKKAVQDQLQPIFMDGFTAPSVSLDGYKTRNDGRRFELYERNRALTLGLGKAVEYALAIGVDRIWERVQHLASLIRRQLKAIGGITVHDGGDQQCGIVTFSVDGVESGLVKSKLAAHHINVSIGNAISTLVYMNKNGLTSIIRASVHYYNTEEEIESMCEVLKKMVHLH